MAKKVLVFDDDWAMVRLVSQVLTQKGYEVLEANNGQEGLRLLFSHKPDVVLLDIVMPTMDGWQACSRIRDISPTIPIIMLTGERKTEEDVARGLDYGADDYLIKPVGNKELVARVQAVLRRAELPSCLDEKGKTITFGDGPDGGREATYSGKAPYPSSDEQWEGEWIFHIPRRNIIFYRL